MGNVDITLNDCLKDNHRYADCFNVALGFKLLQPEYLFDMERILEGAIQFPKLIASYKKERDGIRGYGGNAGAICAVVCIENQTDVDYSQVARQFIYDAYSYNRQLIDIRKSHECKEKKKGVQGEKIYRGFYPEDRLLPVVTVCVYYGEKPWDAPLELRELVDLSAFTEEERKKWSNYIQDYKITVLDIRRMTDEQIDAMESDLKLLFGLLKNSGDKGRMEQFLCKYEMELSEMEDALFQATTSLTNTRELSKLRNKDKGGKKDMCKAIEDMMKDSREKGRLEGRASGIQEGECHTLVNCIIELLNKFGNIPDTLLNRIQTEKNIEVLSRWFTLAVKADSIEVFEAMI